MQYWTYAIMTAYNGYSKSVQPHFCGSGWAH